MLAKLPELRPEVTAERQPHVSSVASFSAIDNLAPEVFKFTKKKVDGGQEWEEGMEKICGQT